MPSIGKLAQKYSDGTVKILMINTREAKKQVASYTRRNDLLFSVLLDSDGEVSRKFSVLGIPAAFIIDKQGRGVFRSIGYRNWNTRDTHQALDSIISE
jgi:peroxiredoxin